MDDQRKRRLAANEAAFRELNERIERRVERWEELDAAFQNVICECSDTDCTQRLPVTPSEYRMVRRHADRFVIARRHDVPDIERVVYRHDRYWVVQKL